jgi:hypothetical protein
MTVKPGSASNLNASDYLNGNRLSSYKAIGETNVNIKQLSELFKETCPHWASLPNKVVSFDETRRITNWCAAYCTGYWTDSILIRNSWDERIWHFQNETDAVLFKLTWS